MKAWQLLDSPEKWTKGENARDGKGRVIEPTAQDACCWCINGILMRMYPTDMGSKTENARCEAWDKLERRIGGNVIHWQDAPERTHQEVLAVLKELDI